MNQIVVLLRLPIFIKSEFDKERMELESQKRGLGIMTTYPDSIDGISDLKDMLGQHQYPESRSMAKHVLTVPIHPFVKKKDMHNITCPINYP